MIRNIRLTDEAYKKIIKIQGAIQMETGKSTPASDAVVEMAYCFAKIWKKRI